MEKKLGMTICEKEQGMTVERYLFSCAGFSRAQIRSMKFRENGICLNGRRVRVTECLHAGDCLELLLEEDKTSFSRLASCPLPLQILYEDEDVLAVHKPAGIAVHPAHGHYADTLANRVMAYFEQKEERVQIRCIGRLDLETSGIVLFAKNQVAAARLWMQREKGQLEKQYLALCEGSFEKMPKGTVEASIAPLSGSLMKMCIHPGGKAAVTHFCVERQYERAALLRMQLETGRTHQIRVHMAYLGHPLVGDKLYGQGGADMERAALHAERMEFRQPFTGERIFIRAEIPEDMKQCLERQALEKDAQMSEGRGLLQYKVREERTIWNG